MRQPFEVESVGEREELVIVSEVLVNKANSFVVVSSPVVDKINGKMVTSVKMLHEELAALKDDTLRLDFMFDEDPWILSGKELRDSNSETNSRYGVSPTFWLAPYSVDGAITKEVAE
jgi:hypothetical protein